MSERFNVGSVIGGRYLVTAEVLVSHDQDVVLDGTDQVLNRPVSILLASPANSEQLSLSAREVATGQRPGSMQVLDLGEVDDSSYLVTSHAGAADLLDLLVQTQPSTYVEPHFTESLGSEIFGVARSTEPETYGGRYDEQTGEIVQYSSGSEPSAAAVPPRSVPDSSLPETSAVAPIASSPVTPAPQQSAQPKVIPVPGGIPDEPAAGTTEASSQTTSFQTTPPASEATGSDASVRRGASHFPAAARSEMFGFAVEDEEEEETPSGESKFTRWIVGGVLAAVLIVALVFAVNSLGGLFNAPVAGPGKTTTSSGDKGATATTPPNTEGQTQPPAVVAPAIDSITRLGTFDFATTFDKDLPKAIDGNEATYWSNMEFGSEDWGGIVKDVPLAVKLKESADIKSITLTQLGGSGGSVTVYTNSTPSMTGAKQVASNSFTSQNLTMTLETPVKAQYVIVDITALPRLAAPKTQYPYGLRLAEIKVS